jgi:aminoglycoside 6'-N-acetyltransferase I
MRVTFWPNSTESEAKEGIGMPSSEGVTFVVERDNGGLAGFAEVDLRKWAEGCCSSPVPYLEGIWVDDVFRRMGLATLLIQEVESWCRSRGFLELGSDCEVSNTLSRSFHESAGFEEVQRNISFRKDL